MYYIAKILQACGLAVVLVGFIRSFPGLMGYRPLIAGILIFICGWLINRLLLRK